MEKILVSLIGHQPLPTLLAIRYVRPDKMVLLGSNVVSVRNRRIYLIDILSLEQSMNQDKITLIPTDPIDEWSFLGVKSELTNALRKHRNAKLICDVTGGTKAMAIGLMEIARQNSAEVIYIVSEQLDTKLWQYRFDLKGQIEEHSQTSIPPLLAIKDLFQAHLGIHEIKRKEQPKIPTDRGDRFERDVNRGFSSYVDDILASVYADTAKQEEIDMVLRKRNKFALVECKSGLKESMDGIKQLNNVGSDRYLGTYTAKILATTVPYQQLAELADLHDIHILELSSWQENKNQSYQPYQWSDHELSKFEKIVQHAFKE